MVKDSVSLTRSAPIGPASTVPRLRPSCELVHSEFPTWRSFAQSQLRQPEVRVAELALELLFEPDHEQPVPRKEDRPTVGTVAADTRRR